MEIRRFATFGSCLIGLGGLSSTALAAPITFNTALPVAEGEFVLREQFFFIKSSDDPSPAEQDLEVIGGLSVLAYGITSDLALFGLLPVLDKSRPRGTARRPNASLQTPPFSTGPLDLPVMGTPIWLDTNRMSPSCERRKETIWTVSTQQHRGMAVRQNEAVAIWPDRILRVEAHDPVPERIDQRSQRHRRAGMARIRLLDRVDGECADRVDRQPIEVIHATGLSVPVFGRARSEAGRTTDICFAFPKRSTNSR